MVASYNDIYKRQNSHQKAKEDETSKQVEQKQTEETRIKIIL